MTIAWNQIRATDLISGEYVWDELQGIQIGDHAPAAIAEANLRAEMWRFIRLL